MTKSQKNSVDEMLAVGISIPKIAAFLHVSQNSIKSYLQRNHPNDVCRNCGTPVLQVPHRKQKKFCCDACRMHYWNTHPQEMRHENAATIPCAFCGKPVLSYRNHPRKYCRNWSRPERSGPISGMESASWNTAQKRVMPPSTLHSISRSAEERPRCGRAF